MLDGDRKLKILKGGFWLGSQIFRSWHYSSSYEWLMIEVCCHLAN